MNLVASTFIILANLTYGLQPAEASSCRHYVKQFEPSFPPESCVCGKALSKLQATVPAPMKVVAACGLRWSNENQIDLSRQRVSLDKYTNGNIPQGEIIITGSTQLSGQFSYEPGPAGDNWFSPRPALVEQRHEALSALLSSFKLGDSEMAKFRVPKSLRNSNCFTAKANITIDGIRLHIGQTDEAGAYPIKFKVLQLSDFGKCKEQ